MTDTTDWLTAIGTCGAVVVSLGLALREVIDRRKRGEREQAEHVTAWFIPVDEIDGATGEDARGLRVNNASNQVVYDLIAQVILLRAGNRSTAVDAEADTNSEYGVCIGNVPPGPFTTRINIAGLGGMYRRYGIELAFRDAAGLYWLRRGNGKLERAYKSPVELFNMPQPVSWLT